MEASHTGKPESAAQMISIVVPVFRSAESLPELHRRLMEVFTTAHDIELILVEDGDGESCWLCIEQIARSDPRVVGIRLSRNYGQHNALLCGIRAARGEIIITMDDDLQHPPEELPKLLLKLREGYDVVYGAPEREQHGLFRNLASRATKLALQGVMGAATAGRVSALRAFRTELRDAFAAYSHPTVNIDVMLTWATTRFVAISVRHEPRRQGVSGYTARALMRHAINMATGFSTRPLRIASLLGLCFAVFGLLVLGYVLIRWLMSGSAVPGFAFLASIIAVFSGAQLLALGIIGEYLARVHLRTMDQPPYLVRGRVGHD